MCEDRHDCEGSGECVCNIESENGERLRKTFTGLHGVMDINWNVKGMFDREKNGHVCTLGIWGNLRIMSIVRL